MFKKLTPVVVVAAIEPILPFWQAFGFEKTIEVPHEGRLGFVALGADGIEVMYQTVDSVRADEAAILEGPKAIGASALFIEVNDLDGLSAQLMKGTDVVVQRRKTFYGSTEMIVRDPAGNVIVFAQMA